MAEASAGGQEAAEDEYGEEVKANIHAASEEAMAKVRVVLEEAKAKPCVVLEAATATAASGSPDCRLSSTSTFSPAKDLAPRQSESD